MEWQRFECLDDERWLWISQNSTELQDKIDVVESDERSAENPEFADAETRLAVLAVVVIKNSCARVTTDEISENVLELKHLSNVTETSAAVGHTHSLFEMIPFTGNHDSHSQDGSTSRVPNVEAKVDEFLSSRGICWKPPGSLLSRSLVRVVPWSPDDSDNAFDIQVGMERPAEVLPRSPGEVLADGKQSSEDAEQTSNDGASAKVALCAGT